MKIFIILVSLLSIKAWAQDGAKSNLDCPFKTLTSKEDQDVLGELQNYFKSFSNTPSCNQASMLGLQTVADLQSALSVANSSEEKCHSQNLEQTKLRDQALASIEKDVEIEPSSSYGICNVSAISKIIGPTVPKDRIIKCITDKFQSAIQECKNVPISESVQDKVTKGIEGLEKTLTQTLSEKNLCSPKMKEALKMAMSTYSKVKPLASFLPWGSVTGVGTDLVESVVDNFFPSDAQRASTIMDDLLSDDSYEKIACLYFNIQQEMYCSSDSGTFENSDPRCNKNSSGGDLVKLLANIHEIKNATNTVLLTDKSLSKTGTDSGLILDTNYLEARIDDFIKYAKSSEEEIRNRIKTLPKIQQAHEREKINYLYHLLDVYQLSNTETTVGIKVGNRALEELMPLLYSSDPSQRINFEQLIVK